MGRSPVNFVSILIAKISILAFIISFVSILPNRIMPLRISLSSALISGSEVAMEISSFKRENFFRMMEVDDIRTRLIGLKILSRIVRGVAITLANLIANCVAYILGRISPNSKSRKVIITTCKTKPITMASDRFTILLII
ncbi:hypothetical protein ES708_19642 [subsurface metagenome]